MVVYCVAAMQPTDTDPTAVAAPTDALDGAAAAARPEGGMERAHLRARLGGLLFDQPSEPVRLGRFVILDKLGEGGMGVVYSAYDPRLDRRVALKLWRAGSGPDAHERLMREAQALARLSHPNVVPVHDVGVLDGQVFIVMEFVVGMSLRAWVQEAERPFERILDVYLQAGRGLAAAHAVGLVHRDVKPDNVLVGSDERVRVVDFGLVRGGLDGGPESGLATHAATDAASGPATRPASGPATRPTSGPATRLTSGRATDSAPTVAPGPAVTRTGPGASEERKLLEQSLTHTGTRMGTPAYMSPEQFAGARVGPASDQFSFCAALYEALYGRPPFAGDTPAGREVEVRAGRVREPPPGSRVPRWVLPVLQRGLRVQPDERWPSMAALLGELGRDRARARRRALLVAGALGLLAVTGSALLRSQPAAPVCEGGTRAMAEVWNADRRARVEQAFRATGRAYAGPAWARVSAVLDEYAGAWAGVHRDVCLAHQRGEQSALLLDRGMACLEGRRQAVDSAVTVLAETTADSLGQAVEVALGLPSASYCGRSDALAAEVPPPEDPAVAGTVAELRRRLGRARALELGARYADALSEARAVVAAAEPLGYEPLLAEALLVQGHVAMNMGAHPDAVAALDRAARLGLAAGHARVAVEAMARRVYAAGMAQGAEQGADIAVYLDLGEALGTRLPERAFLHALLFLNAGAAALARADRATARPHFERALEARDSTSETLPIELVHIRSSLAMVTDDEDQRARLFAQALAELEASLGANHATTEWMRAAAAMYRASPARAHALLERACTAYQRYHPELAGDVGRCLFDLGVLEVELGQPQRAAERFEAVVDTLDENDPEPGLRVVRGLAQGYALLHGGALQAAQAPLQAVLDQLRADPRSGWWIDRQAAQAWLGLGESALALGRREQAAAALERALPLFERAVEKNANLVQQRGLARARVALAMALALQPGDGRTPDAATRARSSDLVARAEQWYRQAGEGYEQRLAELLAWRQAHGLGP
jgi:serine/threonine protein kinase/tetratricopeptide (TPR) repeat protein